MQVGKLEDLQDPKRAEPSALSATSLGSSSFCPLPLHDATLY